MIRDVFATQTQRRKVYCQRPCHCHDCRFFGLFCIESVRQQHNASHEYSARGHTGPHHAGVKQRSYNATGLRTSLSCHLTGLKRARLALTVVERSLMSRLSPSRRPSQSRVRLTLAPTSSTTRQRLRMMKVLAPNSIYRPQARPKKYPYQSRTRTSPNTHRQGKFKTRPRRHSPMALSITSYSNPPHQALKWQPCQVRNPCIAKTTDHHILQHHNSYTTLIHTASSKTSNQAAGRTINP